uniref:BRO1 domain-containing protein n=1 Tax=Macrostomum lignano TaxID=282301 RepID=A0A1I8F7U0_9PLAT
DSWPDPKALFGNIRSQAQFLRIPGGLLLCSNCEDTGEYGLRLAWLLKARESLQAAIAANKDLKDSEMRETLNFVQDVIVGKHESAEKDNNLIYHAQIPQTVPEVQSAQLVKPLAFDPAEAAGPDLFKRLVPMKTSEASSVYSEEVSKKLRDWRCVETRILSLASAQQLAGETSVDESVRRERDPEFYSVSEDAPLPQALYDACAQLSVEGDAAQKRLTQRNAAAGVGSGGRGHPAWRAASADQGRPAETAGLAQTVPRRPGQADEQLGQSVSELSGSLARLSEMRSQRAELLASIRSDLRSETPPACCCGSPTRPGNRGAAPKTSPNAAKPSAATATAAATAASAAAAAPSFINTAAHLAQFQSLNPTEGQQKRSENEPRPCRRQPFLASLSGSGAAAAAPTAQTEGLPALSEGGHLLGSQRSSPCPPVLTEHLLNLMVGIRLAGLSATTGYQQPAPGSGSFDPQQLHQYPTRFPANQFGSQPPPSSNWPVRIPASRHQLASSASSLLHQLTSSDLQPPPSSTGQFGSRPPTSANQFEIPAPPTSMASSDQPPHQLTQFGPSPPQSSTGQFGSQPPTSANQFGPSLLSRINWPSSGSQHSDPTSTGQFGSQPPTSTASVCFNDASATAIPHHQCGNFGILLATTRYFSDPVSTNRGLRPGGFPSNLPLRQGDSPSNLPLVRGIPPATGRFIREIPQQPGTSSIRFPQQPTSYSGISPATDRELRKFDCRNSRLEHLADFHSNRDFSQQQGSKLAQCPCNQDIPLPVVLLSNRDLQPVVTLSNRDLQPVVTLSNRDLANRNRDLQLVVTLSNRICNRWYSSATSICNGGYSQQPGFCNRWLLFSNGICNLVVTLSNRDLPGATLSNRLSSNRQTFLTNRDLQPRLFSATGRFAPGNFLSNQDLLRQLFSAHRICNRWLLSATRDLQPVATLNNQDLQPVVTLSNQDLHGGHSQGNRDLQPVAYFSNHNQDLYSGFSQQPGFCYRQLFSATGISATGFCTATLSNQDLLPATFLQQPASAPETFLSNRHLLPATFLSNRHLQPETFLSNRDLLPATFLSNRHLQQAGSLSQAALQSLSRAEPSALTESSARVNSRSTCHQTSARLRSEDTAAAAAAVLTPSVLTSAERELQVAEAALRKQSGVDKLSDNLLFNQLIADTERLGRRLPVSDAGNSIRAATAAELLCQLARSVSGLPPYWPDAKGESAVTAAPLRSTRTTRRQSSEPARCSAISARRFAQSAWSVRMALPSAAFLAPYWPRHQLKLDGKMPPLAEIAASLANQRPCVLADPQQLQQLYSNFHEIYTTEKKGVLVRQSSTSAAATAQAAAARPPTKSESAAPAASANGSPAKDFLQSLDAKHIRIEPVPEDKRRIRREDFNSSASRESRLKPEQVPNDPFSSLDPLWSHHKQQAAVENKK